MEIESSRFGVVDVDSDRIITFPNGLLGFPGASTFALIQAGEESYFFWLQCTSDPNLAFVVTDPTTFFADYEVPVRQEAATEICLEDERHVQMFVICNKVGEWLTGNLLGPLVINVQTKLGTQVVMTEKKWTTRQPLLKLTAERPLAKSA
ncbi:MAG: flagellar assembly protein FliW [Phycisphaerae bacterium]